MSDPIQEAIDAERELSAERRYMAFEQLRDGMSEALAYRLGGPEPTSDAAIRLVGLSFESMVSHLLGFRGERPWSGTSEMFSRAMLSGDLPALLEGAGNRVLRKEFDSYAGGLVSVCGRVESRDFRDVKAIQVDGDLALKPLNEGGAYAEGYLKAAAETFPIESFGRWFGISRTLFTNDDLAAFGDLARRLGRAGAEFVSGKLAAVLEANGNMADGVAAFATAHGNLGTGGALSETTLAELMKLMRDQIGLDGQRISAVPRALVVPSALEFPAGKLVALLGNPRPLEVVVEPRLTSATAFYLFADPASVDGLAYTIPGGSEGPTIAIGRRPGFTGMQGRITLDVGTGFLDHRGACRNAGQ